MINLSDESIEVTAPETTACCAQTVSSCYGSDEIKEDKSSFCCGNENTQSNNRLLEYVKPLWSAWSLIPAIILMVAVIDPDKLQLIISIALSALAGTMPYIIMAVLLLAYLKASSAEHMVTRIFSGRENRMIILAAVFGGLAPFCSCEVIPFIAGLLALGAPVSAVMAFWLSSPLIDPPSLMITAGSLGWKFAIGKAVAALFVGLLGGFCVKYLMTSQSFKSPLKADSVNDGSCCSTEPSSQSTVWKFWNEKIRVQIFKQQGIENAVFLIKWLALAYLLEALLIIYVPASLIGGIVGGEGLLPIVTGALVGMPTYLNSYAAPPLVAGLMEQGMSSGSAMAFMVAGAISSIPAMTAVWSLVRKPVFFAYLALGLGGAILFGIVFSFVPGM
jgi:uncharacterized protein